MLDIDIAREAKLKPITEIARKIGIKEEDLELYGKYKAKISKIENEKKEGKLILVTAINPTPLGEGKTTISIGLADALNKISKKAILALREPSLGPVFGIKGGATGGGHSQIAPMEDINLHFTGDIHAITSANNLLAAIIDNHIYYGNKKKIKTVEWKRCIDLNDRQLRKIETGLSGEKNIIPREDGFDISVASEIMAILCLAENEDDLKRRIGNIVIGYDEQDDPVLAKDLKAEGALTVLLKDAIKPNIVQTLEHTPVLVHGGPFANIAHGCNSIIATKLAMKCAEYTVTEAGFGADLGAEKFFNIKCRKARIKPQVVVCVATLKAIKYHGGALKESLYEENMKALENGMEHVMKHVKNIQNVFGLPIVIAINKYNQDSEEELNFIKEYLYNKNIPVSFVECWEKGGEGAICLAKKVVELIEKPSSFNYLYSLDESINSKIEKIAKQIYGAKKIEYTEKAKKQIEKIEQMGYNKLPICIAKTQYSFSDDPKNLECKDEFSIHVKEVKLKAGAEFIVILTGKIMTMPGLPEKPAAEEINIDEKGNIIGIF